MLTHQQIQAFTSDGHVTVPNVFTAPMVADALADVEAWSREFQSQMTEDQARWYVERSDTTGTILRKLDEPVFHRPVFRRMARFKPLLTGVEQLIGPGVSVFFSQVFCKPPEVGGPKPVHQDNFYFGPDRADAILTVWVALDDAAPENGCLHYGNGSHLGKLYDHIAPANEPFNLQIPADTHADFCMTAAPVPAGGVSFHHGNTWHQSSSNTTTRSRRAVAIHYIRNDASLINPAIAYDSAVLVKIS